MEPTYLIDIIILEIVIGSSKTNSAKIWCSTNIVYT